MKTLLLLLMFNSAFASTYWVTDFGLTTQKDLQKKSLNTKYFGKIRAISSYEGLLKKSASDEQENEILGLITKAQGHISKENFKGAFATYKLADEKLSLIPNVNSWEDVRLSVLIHLAYLATKIELKTSEAFWRRAHAWNPSARLSTKAFVSNMIKRFRSLDNQIPSQSVHFSAPKGVEVWINGRKLKSDDGEFSIVLEEGLHQVSSLAPGAAWSVQNFAVDESSRGKVINLENRPLVSGSCTQPKYNGFAMPRDTKVLVASEDCELVYAKDWSELESKQGGKPLGLDEAFRGRTYAREEESTLKRWSKSPWFWIGTGAAVLGSILVYQHNQPRNVILIQR